ncbi:helix-turn-helix domain-containing protein [Spirosoma foliorum]|uniref:Helix-turn-helix transcriptional regulator n=1 Tax=Spirosoma foliorum TaxID=2710596 RepID=A0A7G5GS82_9BACT|nr:helix-turn-helix transcriptional regulator [Spirosoma foliorum]QMW01724.1 helix-turn-helix transcriptional regulator [Spirosoma foliorum]
MTISPFDLILLLGSVQGVILAALLWLNPKGNRLPNRLLATLIGLLASMSFAVGHPITNRWVVLVLDLIPLIIAMPIGPLIYFYTKSMLDPAFQFGKTERRHFYPAVLDLGSKFIGWVFITGMLLGFFERETGPNWGNAMDEYDTYVDIPRWLSATIYLFLARRTLRQYKSTTSNQQAGQLPPMRWLWQFVNVFLVFQVIWFIHLVPYIIPVSRGPLLDRFGWYPIYIPIAILIYWLGFKGYLFTRSESSNKPTAKPANADLNPQTVEQVVNALSSAMEQEKLFLDTDLTVDKLGQHLRLPPKLISAVLNQHLHKNFNGFINDYRVDEVKRRLVDPAYEHLTLTGIAFDCGFNSQATFQRTFKQSTGVSPGEYLKNTSQIRI